MKYSLSILFLSLIAIGIVELIQPRIYPPGGLNAFDYLIMLGLPTSACLAGRFWYRSPVFLLYGAAGMMTLLPGFFCDRDLGYDVAFGQSSVLREFNEWVMMVLAVSFICSFVGYSANQSTTAVDHSPTPGQGEKQGDAEDESLSE